MVIKYHNGTLSLTSIFSHLNPNNINSGDFGKLTLNILNSKYIISQNLFVNTSAIEDGHQPLGNMPNKKAFILHFV